MEGKPVLSLALGEKHGVVVAGGEVYSWGAGYLGNGPAVETAPPKPQPVHVETLSGQAVCQVAAGAQHSIARTSDGRLYAWGVCEAGQCGTGVFTNVPLPVPVKQPDGYQVMQVLAPNPRPAPRVLR